MTMEGSPDPQRLVGGPVGMKEDEMYVDLLTVLANDVDSEHTNVQVSQEIDPVQSFEGPAIPPAVRVVDEGCSSGCSMALQAAPDTSAPCLGLVDDPSSVPLGPEVAPLPLRAPDAVSGAGSFEHTVSPSALLATQTEFTVGEKVTYWSDTHGQWMDAVVLRQNLGPDGITTTYDLDVKRGAQAAKIRHKEPAVALDARPYSRGDVGMQTQSGGLRGPVTVEAMRDVPPMIPLAKGAPAIPTSEKSPAAGATPTPQAVSGGATVKGTNAFGMMQSAPGPTFVSNQPPSGEAPVQRYEVGDRVEYWSDTYHQWMEAAVVRVRDNGIYDLDVKRGAQAKKNEGCASFCVHH